MSIGRLRVRAGFVLLLSILTFIDEGMLLWIVWTAAFMHEAGHYIALRLAGGRVESMELHGGGVQMTWASVPPLSYGGELFAVAAGPAVSLILALVFSGVDGIIGEAMALSGICLAHGVFNLLPAKGLDGGRILSLLLERNGAAHDYAILRATSFCTVLLVLASGLWYFFGTGGNASVLLISILTAAALARAAM